MRQAVDAQRQAAPATVQGDPAGSQGQPGERAVQVEAGRPAGAAAADPAAYGSVVHPGGVGPSAPLPDDRPAAPYPPHDGTAMAAYGPVYPPPGRFAGFMLRMWARSPRWLAPAAILACFGGAVAYVLSREPIDGAADTTTCLAKLTTGFDCPGCGGTRAFFFLVQGNLPAAARHHLVFVFAVPFLVYAYLVWAGNRIFRWQLPQLRPGPWAATVFMVVLGVFSILRNLPWPPFNWFYV